jgi:hypothetical protein
MYDKSYFTKESNKILIKIQFSWFLKVKTPIESLKVTAHQQKGNRVCGKPVFFEDGQQKGVF